MLLLPNSLITNGNVPKQHNSSTILLLLIGQSTMTGYVSERSHVSEYSLFFFLLLITP